MAAVPTVGHAPLPIAMELAARYGSPLPPPATLPSEMASDLHPDARSSRRSPAR